MSINFQTPPEAPRQGRPSKWRPILDELKLYPGEWALIDSKANPDHAYVAARYLRNNHAPSPEWEVKARKFEDGTAGIFVRYMGTE